MSDKKSKKILHNCPKCDKKFPTISKLNRHLNKKFPCDVDTNQCAYCGKIFYDVSTKIRHEKLSCKDKPKPQATTTGESSDSS